MPGIALGASDSAGGTTPPHQWVLLEGEFGVFFFLRAVREQARRRPPRRCDVGVRSRGGGRARRSRCGHRRGDGTEPGRGNRHHRRPQDLRRRRDPRRRRRPAGLGGPVRDVRRRAAAPCRRTASTSSNPTQRDAKYQETAWSGTSLGTNKDAGKIRWILQNSYPQVNDLAALAAKAGVQGGLTEQDAAAGTQVAIWRYSDARRRGRGRPAGREARRLSPQERRGPGGAPGVADARPARGLRPRPASCSAR